MDIEKCNIITNKLRNLNDDSNLYDMYYDDVIDATLENISVSIAVYVAYYNFLKDHPEKDAEGKILNKCKEALEKNLNADFVKNNLQMILENHEFLNVILETAKEQTIHELYRESEFAHRIGNLETRDFNALTSKLRNEGINVSSIALISDKGLTEKYVQATDDEKELIGKQIDDITAQNLTNTIQDYKDDNPKRKINIPEEDIMKKTDDLELSTEDKKIVINFVVDPSIGQRKTTPIISMPKNKFRTLRNTVTKYLKWLEEKNYKVESGELVNSNGEKQTVVYIKHGEIFNITLSCTNIVKDAINKGVKRINKAKKWLEDTSLGPKKTISKISERRKAKKELRNAKLKQGFAPVVDYASVVADKLSKKAKKFSTEAHEKAEEMRAIPVDDLKEKLNDLKKKRGVATGGATVELIDPPEVNPQMHI